MYLCGADESAKVNLIYFLERDNPFWGLELWILHQFTFPSRPIRTCSSEVVPVANNASVPAGVTLLCPSTIYCFALSNPGPVGPWLWLRGKISWIGPEWDDRQIDMKAQLLFWNPLLHTLVWNQCGRSFIFSSALCLTTTIASRTRWTGTITWEKTAFIKCANLVIPREIVLNEQQSRGASRNVFIDYKLLATIIAFPRPYFESVSRSSEDHRAWRSSRGLPGMAHKLTISISVGPSVGRDDETNLILFTIPSTP